MTTPVSPTPITPTWDDVEDALRDVIDPELGYNIVDLGLIYGIAVEGDRVGITMTMTTRGCPAAEAIRDGVRERVSAVPGVREAEVEVVWIPPWSPAAMSAAAKSHFGFA
ncbi:MAG TPA: metal-sulfur cluster assembly factor [Alphaproteobacteria bacterium]|nr:metal-sulfur cluster assembly factor [Alphaproteobacteria bacterium]